MDTIVARKLDAERVFNKALAAPLVPAPSTDVPNGAYDE